MRRKFFLGIGMLAFAAAGAGSATAADIAARPAPPPPVAAPAFISDWAGFYIGINGGGGWAHTKFDFTPVLNTTASGGLVGGHVGYNWQYGSVVAGLEADFDGADIKHTVLRVEQKTNELASARGRLGYLVFPSLLAYGTGGVGWGHTEISTPGFLSDEVNQFGWVAGAGLEYKLVDHVLLRAEYLHYDFAKTEAPNAVGDNFKETVDVLRGGLSYKF